MRPPRFAAVGVLLCLLVPCLPRAHAAGINELRREVAELEQQSRTLAIRHRTQAASNEQLAEHRLVDAQVLFNLRDYTRAAIILLDYISKYKNTRGYPDALFFLADSLYHKGDYLSARRYFRKIVNEVRGRYYQEALQRLIELSLRTGDSSDIDNYLAALANIPPHELKPSVPYVKGKYFFFKRKTDEAIASFQTIAPGKKYYMQAQYFVGACLVRKKDYAGASKVFSALLRVKPKTSGDRHVRELAHLALGRLLYQKNKIAKAIDQYQKISRRSKEFDTALYEICWAYIKASKYKQALRALDLLILAQPDSPFAPEVRVLQGNLLIRMGQWGRATELFTKAREKFLPVQRRMHQLLVEHSDPNVFFDALLARNLSRTSVTIKVPQLAAHWVKERPKVKRALNLVKGVREIDESLVEIDQLIRRLQRAINSPAKIKIFPQFATAKASSLEVENRLTIVRRKILNNERALVAGVSSGAEKEQLETFAARREVLEKEIQQLPTSVEGFIARRRKKVGKLVKLEKELSRLSVLVQNLKAQLVAAEKYFADTGATKSRAARREFQRDAAQVRGVITGLENQVNELGLLLTDAKDAAGVGGPQEVAERSHKQAYGKLVEEEHQLLARLRARLSAERGADFDSLSTLLHRCRAIDTTLGSFNTRLDGEVEQKLAAIRAILDQERSLADKHKGEIGEYRGQTDIIAGAITYQGFRAVAQRFYEIVVRADVGIIDVAWALKDQKSKQVSKLVQQQKLDLKLLDDEFREILKED